VSRKVRNRPALAAAAVAAAICGLVSDPALLSAVVVLWFLAVVPGTLLCTLLDVEGGGAFQWAVIIGASFAVDAIVSQLLRYTHIWTPDRALLVLVALSLVVLLAAPRVRTMSRG
jgi:hypothetical protein